MVGPSTKSHQRVLPSDITKFPWATPPLPEQTAIAAFLDRETAKIDALVEEQRRLIDLLKEKRQAVISHAVTRGLNPAAKLKPSGVDWLGDVPDLLIKPLLITLACLAGPAASAPPELFDGFRAGDKIEALVAQQGWYPCETEHPALTGLCLDDVDSLGKSGTYRVEFLEGRAFEAEYIVSGPSSLPEMLREISAWRDENITLVSFSTRNTTVDIMKANHDLGAIEAMQRFGKYLNSPAVNDLVAVTLVPLAPPTGTFPSAQEYLNTLPTGGILLRLIKDETRFVTSLRLVLLKQDAQLLFPNQCLFGCLTWCLPPASDPNDRLTVEEWLTQRYGYRASPPDPKYCK